MTTPLYACSDILIKILPLYKHDSLEPFHQTGTKWKHFHVFMMYLTLCKGYIIIDQDLDINACKQSSHANCSS